jgi:exonuclease III
MRFARTALAVLVSLLLVQYSFAEDRRPDPSVLVIMTFNAEFLWDGVQPEEGQADFPWKGSQTEAEEHMRRIAEVIIRANPDVINLVEVENLTALSRLNDLFLAGRGYRPFLVKGTDTATGQDVGLLTRIDPEGDQIRRDARQGQSGSVLKSVSKNYIATLPVGATRISIIGLHLLAQPLNESRRIERQAQADAIRGMARDERMAGALVAVLGDFNDYEGNADSLDHIDSSPISTVLSDIRAMNPSDDADDLTNVASLVPKGNRFTSWFDRNDNGMVEPPQEFTSIDHLLVSPELVPFIESVEFPHELNPPEVSDHFPIVVRLRLADAPEPSGGAPRIISLLPNPSGDESQNEAATIRNIGTLPVSLAGWKLRDLAGQTWLLDSLGSLAAGTEGTIVRLGQPMAMNNAGDTIDLVDPTGTVVQTVSYGRVDEGELVTPAVP